MIDTFVVDLDGTILQEDGLLSPIVRDYMIEIQKLGFTLVVATGRKHTEAAQIIKQLQLKEHKNAIILSDGQYLIDYSDNSELTETFLEFPNDYDKIICYFKDGIKSISLITPTRDYVVYSTIWCVKFWKSFIMKLFKLKNPFDLLIANSKIRINDIEKISIVTKYATFVPDGDIKKSYYMSFVNDKRRYEIKSNKVNKCEALKKYLVKKNISPEHVAVFGNDENDMCLFDFFKSSYVVDTACQNVRNSAGIMIPHEGGIGVIRAINKIIESRDS